MYTHVVFLDESGDHSLQHIDRQFPVFALAATIFEGEYYLNKANPMIDRLKYNYWGHRSIIFHSVDIRKQKGDFHILREAKVREEFTNELNMLIRDLDFKIIAAGIDKIDHLQQYIQPESPYNLTFEFIMERLFFYFKNTGNSCMLVAESRDKKENDDLYAVFDRLMERGNENISAAEFRTYIKGLKFYPKKVNENGNQITDLIVYPIARKIIGRAAGYQPYIEIKPKFYSRPNGNFWGYGLKAFPYVTNKKVQGDPD